MPGKLTTKELAQRALAARFSPELLDRDLRAEDLRTLVLPTIDPENLAAAIADIDGGDGREREVVRRADGTWQRPKLHSAYSSCGLALNAFGPWRIDSTSLTVRGETGFARLRLEERLRIFGRGRAPNLDVVLAGTGRALAIESKLTEHLSPRPAPPFSAAYKRLENDTDQSWWAMYCDLKPNRSFRYLDAVQLVKHYFGLKRYCVDNKVKDATLLYLYWEPEDAEDHDELVAHATEVRLFAETLNDPVVSFRWMSYAALWAEWDKLEEPAWLREHLVALRERYAVRLA